MGTSSLKGLFEASRCSSTFDTYRLLLMVHLAAAVVRA